MGHGVNYHIGGPPVVLLMRVKDGGSAMNDESTRDIARANKSHHDRSVLDQLVIIVPLKVRYTVKDNSS